MTIEILVRELKENTDRTKLVHDFKSKFTQISTSSAIIVWSGLLPDLGDDELQQEIIPALLMEE